MMSPSGIYWNPDIFVSEKPMQNFVECKMQNFLVEKKGPQKKEEIEKMTFIVVSSAHTSLGPQNRDDHKEKFWDFFKTYPPQLFSIIEADH